MVNTLKTLGMFLIIVFFLVVTSVASPEPNISISWEKEISQVDRGIKSYTIKIEDDNVVRVIGVSFIPRTKEVKINKDPKLFEYRIDLEGNKSEMKTLLSMDEEDIAVTMPEAGVKDSRLIDDSIIIIRNQNKSFDFQELMISSDWQVKTREIPGLTRSSVSTHGACRSLNGDVFLCGNSGYIRKVKRDGSITWDTNYKSDKGEDGTSGVIFSESEKMLVAFGFSFEPDTKFTAKDPSLWLANLDSEGIFKAKTEFKGIVNLGKSPSFCLSTSDDPIVIYDNEPKMQGYRIFVSKFSKDLRKKEWTRQIFEKKDMMVQKMSIIPVGEDNLLAVISAFGTKGKFGRSLCFYILDSKGNIINQAVFEDMWGLGYQVEVFEDRIFFVTDGRNLDDMSKDVSRLICFEIHPCVE
jgi:hypothetical protein